METIVVDQFFGKDKVHFVASCKNCGAVLVSANQGLGLDHADYFDRCRRCGNQADRQEIDAAWMRFKQELVRRYM